MTLSSLLAFVLVLFFCLIFVFFFHVFPILQILLTERCAKNLYQQTVCSGSILSEKIGVSMVMLVTCGSRLP